MYNEVSYNCDIDIFTYREGYVFVKPISACMDCDLRQEQSINIRVVPRSADLRSGGVFMAKWFYYASILSIYIVPLVLIIIVSVVVFNMSGSEGLSILSSISFMIVYYLILHLVLRRLFLRGFYARVVLGEKEGL